MKRAVVAENVRVHETGAKRGTDTEGLRYDLLSPIVMMELAATMKEGADKHGDNNYLKGFKICGLMNHAMNHIQLFMLGDTSENHLAHAVWNLNAVMHFLHTRPELDDRFDYGLSNERIQQIKKNLEAFKHQIFSHQSEESNPKS